MLYERIHNNGEKIAERHVKAFLDLLVLGILNGNSLYGYKIIAAVHKEFGVLLSPGSLYPLLHMLEEKKMVSSEARGGKIVYASTPDGKRVFRSTFTDYRAAVQQLCSFMNSSSEPTSQGL
jgi:DNA-binding PadR family transcriptional regulator